MNTVKKELIVSGGFVVSFLTAVTLSKGGQHVAACLLLLCTAILFYVCFWMENKNLVELRALLSLFWIGGIGVAVLQLSNWQTDWHNRTWISFGLFYLTFIWFYKIGELLSVKKKNNIEKKEQIEEHLLNMCLNQRLYICIWIVAVVSMLCFLLEVLILGYIPIFAEETHAYNTFHVTGLHYFTFSCMFVHPLTLIYILRMPNRWKRKWKSLLVLNIMALSIAIMCVSKFQFVLTIMLPIFIFLLQVQKINWKRIAPIVIGIGLFATIVMIVMVYRRNYESGYLNGIFDMKDQSMPILIQYIYMYIANNFENFNCLVATMEESGITYAGGMRMLFPVFALTGLKFKFPHLVNYPIYVVVTELNTLTILYDAYYDFGLIGVVLFGAILGIVCAVIAHWTKEGNNPVRYLLYGQIAMYQMLSFFSTWYSNPTTWFWFAITILICIYVVFPTLHLKKYMIRLKRKTNKKESES